MKQSKHIFNSLKIKLAFILINLFASQLVCSSPSIYWFKKNNIRPIISIGGGLASTSHLGRSQNFTVQNPETDEFFYYSAKHPVETRGLADIFIGAEKFITSKWATQIGVGYNQTFAFTADGVFQQGADAQSTDLYTYHYNVLVRQLLLEGKLLSTFKKHYHPYFFAGVGPSFNTAYGYTTNVPSYLTFTRMYRGNTISSWSYAIGAGLDADILPHVRVGAGYRFADLGRVKLGSSFIDDVGVARSLSQTHLYVNQVLAQFTWVFH